MLYFRPFILDVLFYIFDCFRSLIHLAMVMNCHLFDLAILGPIGNVTGKISTQESNLFEQSKRNNKKFKLNSKNSFDSLLNLILYGFTYNHRQHITSN